MWTGIYGKYPDHAYLTDADKSILLRSPFFYRDNGEPVVRLGKVVARFTHPNGAFEQHESASPVIWTETNLDGSPGFTFVEAARDDVRVTLKDGGRGYWIRIPVQGGRSLVSADHGRTWSPLYDLTKAPPE
jgi:hypothetical protein